MGIIIDNFSAGWQNKARKELMKDDALYMCKNVNLDELGSFKCRNLYVAEEYFGKNTQASMIKNVYFIDVEGVSKYLIFYAVGDSLYCYNSSTDATRTISTAMTGDHVCYAPLKHDLEDSTYVFVTDGTTMLSDNGVETKTWGLDGPTNLPIVAMVGSGGNLTAGDYSYRYTFYDEDTGTESDPSIVSAYTTAGATDSANLTNITISSDTRVTKRRIYRTLVDAAGGTHYLAGTINDNVSTIFTDTIADADLTTELNTDQGIPPTGDIVVAYMNRLFLGGSIDYPNRSWFSGSEKPDNWNSTDYLDVGTSNDKIVNMVVFEGKLYFMQSAGISGLYGSDSNTFAWHQTRSHVGISARWGVAVGPDGIYFVSHDGIYRFDGLKSMRISDAIGRSFGLVAEDWVDIVDKNTVSTVARACFLLGIYYVLLPMKDVDGTVTNNVLAYDVYNQTWIQHEMACGSLTSDTGRGKVYGGLPSGGSFSVYELFSVASSNSDTPLSQVVTKAFSVVDPESGHAVGWIRKFRVDCKGNWTLYFYLDEELVHTQVANNQDASTRYQWYDFGPNLKGRYLQVRILATGVPNPIDYVFNELEVV